MKKILLSGLSILLLTGLNLSAQRHIAGLKVKADTLKADSIEYKLIVFDPGFDSWLVTKPSMNYYSNDYYRIKNKFYVTEWNYRYSLPLKFGSRYDSRIEYDPAIDYGLELNYRLYYYFLYFEEKNHTKLLDSPNSISRRFP